MKKALIIILCLLNGGLYAQSTCGLSAYTPVGDPGIRDCVADIDKYLARAMNLKGLTSVNAPVPWDDPCNDPAYACTQDYTICPSGYYCPGRYCDDIAMAVNAKAALLLDVAGTWGDEWKLFPGTNWYNAASKSVQDINRAYDCAGLQRPIIGAFIGEWVSKEITGKKIPDDVLRAFADDPDFRLSDFPAGATYDQTRIEQDRNPGTPDISKLQARMWVYQCARTYVSMGYKHLQVDVIGWSLGSGDDPTHEKSYRLLSKIRSYAASIGSFVLISSSVKDNHFFYDSKMLFDFRLAPLRPMETNYPLNALCRGQNDAALMPRVGETYSQTMGGYAPNGCYYDRIPFLVVFDHHAGICGTPGVADELEYCIYGYDESRWLSSLSQDCQQAWLKYALKETRKISARGYVAMPGRLILNPWPPSSYRLVDHPIVYNAIKNEFWQVDANLGWSSSWKTVNLIGNCGAEGTAYTAAYSFSAIDPDLTSVITWDIQKPDGTMEPLSYGYTREYQPAVSGYYTISMGQHNMGFPHATGYVRKVEKTIFLNATFCRNKFVMSPNPGRSNLAIQANYPIKDIAITSVANGTLMTHVQDVNLKSASLDTRKLQAGIYVVRVLYDDGNYELQALSVAH